MIKGSGIDLKTYAKKDLPHNDPIKIVFAARIIQEKGILDLIDAAEILRPEYENKCQILICGDIESNPHAISKEELDRRCDGRYIIYKGHCPNMQQILETSDIAVLPSYYREGLPKFLIEANAIGRPIITTNSVGCKDAVVDGYNGFVVPIKMHGPLLKIANPDRRSAIESRNGRPCPAICRTKFLAGQRH